MALKFRFVSGVGGRLLIILLGLTALPALLIGGLAYQNARKTVESRVAAQLVSIASLKKEEIMTWMDGRVADVRLLTDNFLNEEHFTEILDSQTKAERRAEFSAFLIDNLRGVQQARRGYSELFFVDANGHVVLSTNPARIGARLAADPAVSGTLTSPTGALIRDIHRSADGQLEMSFGHILHEVNLATKQLQLKVNGAVIIRVRMEDALYPLLRGWPGMGSTGETVLVRAEGDETAFLNPLRLREQPPLTFRLLGGSIYGRPAQLAAAGHEGIMQALDYRGVPVLAAYRSIPQTRWGFVAKVDLAEAFAPVGELSRQWGVITSLVLLAAFGVALLLARALARPLAQLAVATQAIAAGQLDTDVPVHRADELGDLAESFRAMIAAVRTRDANLRAHTEEVTRLKDLSQRLLESLDPDRVLEFALHDIHNMLSVDFSAILLLDRSGEYLSAEATCGWPAGQSGELTFRVGRETAAGYSIAKRAVIHVTDVDAENRFGVPTIVRQLGVKSVLAVPMFVGERPQGAFWLLSRTPWHWDDKKTQFVSLVANQTAVALERARLFHDLGESYDRTLDALAAALDARDKETEGHSRRVVAYTLALGQRMNLSESNLATLRRGALLHDIGKIGVPDAILLKPGPLTEDEWVIMRRHPEWGQQILAGIPFLAGAAQIVLTHQERWDGRGYPQGLQREQIPLGARIFAVADAFDAITSDRPYRRARPNTVARAEIMAGSGTQFDSRVVEVFLQFSESEWTALREGAVRADTARSGLVWPRREASGASAIELEALNRLIAAVSGSLNLKDVLREVARTTVETLGAAASGLFLYDSESDTLTLAADAGLPEALKDRFTRFPVAGFHNESVVRDGLPRVKGAISDIPEFASLGVPDEHPDWGAYLCAPLTAKGQVAGVMGVISRRPHAFDDRDLALYQTIGEYIGLAIANARLHQSVQQLARTDSLTGAYNRRHLDEVLQQEIARCARYHRIFSIVMLDIDRFKSHNDRLGHLAGDEALRQLVQLIEGNIRGVDSTARYGGEEFVLVLPETDASEAQRVAERIRMTIERHVFLGGTLTASFGVAECDGTSEVNPEALIAMADQALYEAKRQGRNRVVIWEPELATFPRQTQTLG